MSQSNSHADTGPANTTTASGLQAGANSPITTGYGNKVVQGNETNIKNTANVKSATNSNNKTSVNNKGSGTINYTTTYGITPDAATGILNQVASIFAVNGGSSSGGSGFGTTLNNTSPPAFQDATTAAATTSTLKWVGLAALALGGFAVWFFSRNKK